MGMEVKGRVHIVGDTQQKSDRFTKREFVLELADNPKYPQLVQFQLTGDRCALLDDIQAGDEVQVEFSLRGREWRSPSGDTKYFNSLDVWKLQRLGAPRAPSRTAGGAGGDTDDPPFASSMISHEPSPIAPVLR